MIRSFRNKALAELWATGRSRIDARLQKRIVARLESIDLAETIEDISLPGYDFHRLRSFRPTRYTVHVNGPWCITFEFEEGDAFRLDLEQYR